MDTENLNLSDFFPYQISVLATRISRRMLATYKERFGRNVSEWRVIAHVARCERVSVREIHNCVNLDKPTVSRAVKQLVTEKLLDRTPSETDQRLVEISLTKAGRKVYREIAQVATEIELQLLDTLTAQEKKVIARVFEKLHVSLDKDPLAPARSKMDIPEE